MEFDWTILAIFIQGIVAIYVVYKAEKSFENPENQ